MKCETFHSGNAKSHLLRKHNEEYVLIQEKNNVLTCLAYSKKLYEEKQRIKMLATKKVVK